jgi:hypothetical protein
MIPPEMHRTPDNPYALTFDPGYVYGPNQGVRSFLVAIYFKIILRQITNRNFKGGIIFLVLTIMNIDSLL